MIDDMNRRSAAEREARRYRRHSDASVWKVHSQARNSNGPVGPVVLLQTGVQRCETITVSVSDFERDFARCDGEYAMVAPSAIPTPDALAARIAAADATAVGAFAARVAQALSTQWQPGGSAIVAVPDEPDRVLRTVVERLRAQGWDVVGSMCAGGTITITETKPPLTAREREELERP